MAVTTEGTEEFPCPRAGFDKRWLLRCNDVSAQSKRLLTSRERNLGPHAAGEIA